MDHAQSEAREAAMQNAIAVAIAGAYTPETTALEIIRALNNIKVALIEADTIPPVLH